MINVILQSLEIDLVNINVYAKFYQNFPNGLRVVGIFRELSGDNFTNSPVTDKSEFGPRQSVDQRQIAFDSPLGLHPVNISVHAKFHHNIPLGSRDKHTESQPSTSLSVDFLRVVQ